MRIRTTWRAEHGLEVFYLGEIPVGRVAPYGGRNNRPRWLFNLAGVTAFWRDAKTMDDARDCLMVALAEWLTKAGLK